MASYEATLRVARPVEATFAFVSEFHHAASWDPRTYAAEKVTDGPTAVGTRFVLTGGGLREETLRRFRIPRRLVAMALPYDVVAFDPPHSFVLEGQNLLYRWDDHLRFEPDGDGNTLLHYAARLELRGPLRVFEPVLRRQFGRIGDDATNALARVVEAA